MKNIVVLASGTGTTFEYLYNHLSNTVDFKSLIVDRNCYATELAHKFGVKCSKINNDLLDLLDKENPDLIVLAGFLKLIPSEVTEKYENKIINIHPSLLPKFGGKSYYGRRVHQAVYDANELVSGATVHFVNSKYDEGAIIAQRFVYVKGLNVDDIEEKVKKLEKKLLLYVVKDLLNIE